jgi:predicted transglutaminase-like cysteine proteinase
MPGVSDLYAAMSRINNEVNAATRYVSDPALYGTPELWTCADGEGDCEDYALEKRRRLLACGFGRDALRLAVVFTETEEGRRRLDLKRQGLDWPGDHAVLIVRVPEGDYILDNRHPSPMDLKSTGYVIDRLQVAGTTQWEHGSLS